MISFLFEGKFKNCLYSSSTFIVSCSINFLILYILTKFLKIENLYSDKKTLAEEYGFEYMNNELSMRSNFYNKKILYKK